VRRKGILVSVAAALLISPAAHAGETGGFAYDPLPNRASPVNPGSIPGESGGSGYVHPADPKGAQPRKPPRRRSPSAASQLGSNLHRFPVLGEHSFGGEDARFGARRPGHRHQGQDIVAAEGTPVVAPRGGTITWRAFQARGAGYYLVLDAVGEPYYYVFMHLARGSIAVSVGDRVRTGQPLAGVGSTGSSSGPHLHFEIWRGPWYDGGAPIDPLPALLAWDVFS
jgi:murein DD-endopeptidase MepM/ murein hydrolase activator NlpD